MAPGVTRSGIDVAILCGGKGTRLQAAVSDRPKPMAEVRGRPFLDHLIDYVASFDLARFILCTGYMSDFIEDYYRREPRPGLDIVVSREEEPLGTGGALKQALLCRSRTESVLVLNGDTFCHLDYRAFLDFHTDHSGLISIAVTASVQEDQGVIALGPSGRVLSFSEKSRQGGDLYASAGVYLMQREVLALMPPGQAFSLEYDVFPSAAQRGGCYGFVSGDGFLDIGTPERYHHARTEGF
jgi:NDP-sugar pyrophosphorylase family protein